MNIDKYQDVADCDKSQKPQQVREELKNLLNAMKRSLTKTETSIKIYNLLCGVDALLCRYETVNREAIFAIEYIEEDEELRNYLLRVHLEAENKAVCSPNSVELGKV